MRTLAIDSATEACSVALFEDDTLLAGDWALLGRGHAERLVPMIAALPGRGRAGRIAVATGPGSFTGIRVGLAAARALALAWKAKLAGYGTLALVAAQARDGDGARCAQALTVAMTGGHGEWFVQQFGPSGEALGAAASLTPADAVASAAEWVAGSQAEALVARRGGGRAEALWPDARRLGLLDAAALAPDPRPSYGRAPDARLPGAVARAR